MVILLKSLLLLGTFTLLGPGVAAHYLRLRPGGGLGRWGYALLWLGATMIVLVSLSSIVVTMSTFGGLDLGLSLDYLLNSRHGRITLIRIGLVTLLLGLGLHSSKKLGHIFYSLIALAFLATLSWTGHAGALGETLPVVADICHLAAAAIGIGAVMGLALLPLNQEALARSVVPRVSSAGLFSVLVLIASGVYSASLHLFGLSALTTSSYGQVLLLKIALVVVILGIAAVNRWWLLPNFEKHGVLAPLRRLVRLELLLLIAVLVATGVLSSTEPAHPPGFHQDHLE